MIRVESLNKIYDAGRRYANHVLRNVSFTLPDTGFICIVGASGCGKTSLLNAVGGLDSFDSGTMTTGSASVSRYGTREWERERNNNFGYIFQNYYLLGDHTVAYNVYLGLHALDLTHQQKLQRVREALKAVNMDRFRRRIASELSGGQQQRVAIARALARRPRVIFADEPTGNLDEENTLNICTLLRRISKTSLVVMVTHEMNVARFFADRIITLSAGEIESDSDSWERSALSVAGSGLYAGDYAEERTDAGQVKLRVLHEKDAPPVELTVAVLRDRIILKLDDGRTVSCSAAGEDPVISEGKRPQLVLEAMDNQSTDPESAEASPAAASVRAGKGLTLPMMAQEAGRLLGGKGRRFLSTWIFLAAMAVLTTFIVSDYLTVSSIDPKDFVITDSHILQFDFERGPELPNDLSSYSQQVLEYQDYLKGSGLNYEMMPLVNETAKISTDAFIQMGTVSENIGNMSHVPIALLDESKLIYGRMPEKTDEVVIDRWVLDSFLSERSIIQSTIPDITDMLGMKLEYSKKSFSPTIVGICDCGDPTMYLTPAGMASVGRSGCALLPLSELQEMYPGEYDDVELGLLECIVIYNNAGDIYKDINVRKEYRIGGTVKAKMVASIAADTWANAVVSDETIAHILLELNSATNSFAIYCEDKQAVKAYLAQGLPESLDGQIIVEVTDRHGDSWAKYTQASNLKADARTIITVTIIVLCMVMLYLLQRSCVQQRIGMMAVYRLLGIPRRKLLAIFSMESLLLSVISVAPAAGLTWAVIRILNRLPSLEFSMVLPVGTAALVAGAIAAYYLVVSLLPTYRLLMLPPSRLAVKYDL